MSSQSHLRAGSGAQSTTEAAVRESPARQRRGNQDAQARIRRLTGGTEHVLGETIEVTPDLLALLAGGDAQSVESGVDGTGETDMSTGTAFVHDPGEDKTGVNADDVTQGQLANCYFMAAMKAVARANPQAIHDLISENDDGTYDVTLYVKEHVWSLNASPKVYTVSPTFPTQGGRTLGAEAGDSVGDTREIWPMLLEKAFAIHCGSYKETEYGFGGAAMQLLTGQDTDNVGLLLGLGLRAEATILADLAGALTDKKAVTAATGEFDADTLKAAKAAYPGRLGQKHVYAVKEVDVEGKTISLDNPWGGDTDIDHMPVADFKKFFRQYDIVG